MDRGHVWDIRIQCRLSGRLMFALVINDLPWGHVFEYDKRISLLCGLLGDFENTIVVSGFFLSPHIPCFTVASLYKPCYQRSQCRHGFRAFI